MYLEARCWICLAKVALTFAAISLILTILWMPESPRFLHGKKKYDEATEILQRIQKTNAKNLSYKFNLGSSNKIDTDTFNEGNDANMGKTLNSSELDLA